MNSAKEYKILFPFPFRSGNHSTGRKGKQHFTVKAVRLYRLAVRSQLEKICNQFPDLKLKLPIRHKLDIELMIFPPDRRKRDKDNIEKVFQDALTKAGFWIDDYLIGKKVCLDYQHVIKYGLIQLRFSA